MSDVFDTVKERLLHLQTVMKLSNEEVAHLMAPKRISHTELVVDREKYPAWRVLHSNALGPGKGGIRYHPEVNEGEVKSLAFWMSLKNSLAGLPYGGAKGGIRLNPKSKTPKELERISRAYVDAFYKNLGEDIDVPAPDVYTNPQIMAWMLDQYEKKTGRHAPAMITGKPVGLHGLVIRSDATARGGFIIIKELVESINTEAKDLSVAVQGFGNAGAHIARMLHEEGFKVVAVSDSKGGIWDKDGLDIPAVAAAKEDGGTVGAYKKGKQVSNEELLELKVDLLVLAALENQITKKNADKIKAKYVVELANGPVDPEADAVLRKKKTLVVPDILANSGGVIASYFEWAQNKVGSIFENDFLERKLTNMMRDSWNRVYMLHLQREEEIDMRTAAYILAVERILQAEKYRGYLV